MKIEFRTSKDGSHTLFLPHLNETYHSLHGAIQESMYVFIEKGLSEVAKDKERITVLEIGFGTGLNALLTYLFAHDNSKEINYHTLEPHPLTEEVYKSLNYVELLNAQIFKEAFYQMHVSPDGKEQVIKENFFFSKYRETLENFAPEHLLADVVFFDAFAPSKQPEVWALDNLKKVRKLMKPDGILVTYCAMGQFKRDLKEAGFTVETLQGPPGKKEMTRGTLNKM